MKLKVFIPFFFLCLLTTPAFAASKLTFAETTPPQFTYEITDQGLGLDLTEAKNSRKTSLKPKYTISDVQKLSLLPAKGDRLVSPVEMLLVVLAKGNPVQTIQVFVPAADEKVIASSQTDPICELENFGDFSWEKPSDLSGKIRLVKKGRKQELQIRIGKMKNPAKPSSVRQHWLKCFSF
jgi:hypothetical protein